MLANLDVGQAARSQSADKKG
jgi:hypothetical protein